MNVLANVHQSLEHQWFEASRLRALVLGSLAIVRESGLGKGYHPYQASGDELEEVLEVVVERLISHIDQLGALKETMATLTDVREELA